MFGYVKVFAISGCSSRTELMWRVIDATYTVVVTIVVNQGNTTAIFVNVTSSEIENMNLNVFGIIDGCIEGNAKVNIGFETDVLVFFMGQPEDGRVFRFPVEDLSGSKDNREPGGMMYIELVNSTVVDQIDVSGI